MTSEIRFGELASLRKDSTHPSQCPDLPYVGLEHIQPGALRIGEVGLASDVSSQKLRFQKGDILFGRLRPYFRKVASAPFEGICSTDIWVVTGQDPADNEFLKYWMASDDFIRSSTHASEGSGMPRAQWDWVKDFRTTITSSRTRRAIGRTLGLLDEKIALNLLQSKLLEQIAQTIFKSWFVDFDPVRAKSLGEQPEGMDAETAALFPDSFEESELGLIPSGWTCSTVGQSFSLTMGQSPPGNAYNESGEGLPFFQGRTDFGQRFPALRMFSIEGKRVAASGDTLVSVRAPVGDLNQALEPCILGRGLAALRHKSDSESYTYCMARALQTQLEYFNGEGSVFGAINRKDFEALNCIEPSQHLVSKFHEVTEAMNQQIRLLHEQSLLLKNLLDSLLPRLISGELEIPEEALVD